MSLRPPPFSRRSLLTAAALGAASAALAGCGDGQSAALHSKLPDVPPRPLPIPPLLAATPGVPLDLRVQVGQTEFVAGRPAPSWGVNGPYLGPTLHLRRGEQVRIRVRNDLPEETTMHWHGMHLPAEMDGGPHQPIGPGKVWEPTWLVDQPSATLWYHPHHHGQTSKHVYRGVAGMIIVDDGRNPGLPAAYGVDDIPLVIQDRNFSAEGQPQEYFGGTFGPLGPDMLVNGVLRAQFTPSTTRVRFRILNGSNTRVFNLAWSDNRPFAVVAGDAGLLPRAETTDRLSLSPGERAEMVVEFRPGEQVTLRTLNGPHVVDAGDFDLLGCQAGPQLASSPAVPDELGGPAPVQLPADPRVRRMELQDNDRINGRTMDMTRIDETVAAGAREIWEIVNTVYAHNFHIHGVDFTVLEVNGKPPAPALAGRKDTVFVPPGHTARVAVEFRPFTDPHRPYMYHCHILRHEDAGMMGQFLVVPPGEVDKAPRTVSTHHH